MFSRNSTFHLTMLNRVDREPHCEHQALTNQKLFFLAEQAIGKSLLERAKLAHMRQRNEVDTTKAPGIEVGSAERQSKTVKAVATANT